MNAIGGLVREVMDIVYVQSIVSLAKRASFSN